MGFAVYAVRARPTTRLMPNSIAWRLQRLDGAADAPPQVPAFKIVQFKHAIDHPRRLDNRLGAVALDDQVGGSIDVQVRDHLPRCGIGVIAQRLR